MFLLLGLASCFADVFHIIKERSELLHRLTKFATYYELFGIPETASPRQIKLAYRKIRSTAPPAGVSQSQFQELVSNGYALLNEMKAQYDDVLNKNSSWLFGDDRRHFTNSALVLGLSGLVALLLIDFSVFGLRYLIYSEQSRASKKQKGKKEKQAEPPVLVSGALLSGIRRRVFG